MLYHLDYEWWTLNVELSVTRSNEADLILVLLVDRYY